MKNIKEIQSINNEFLFDDEVLESKYSWMVTFENNTVAILKITTNNYQNEMRALEWVKTAENNKPYNIYLLEEVVSLLREKSLENILKNI